MRKKELIMRFGAAEEQIEALEERVGRLEAMLSRRTNKPTKTATELKSEWWNGEKK